MRRREVKGRAGKPGHWCQKGNVHSNQHCREARTATPPSADAPPQLPPHPHRTHPLQPTIAHCTHSLTHRSHSPSPHHPQRHLVISAGWCLPCSPRLHLISHSPLLLLCLCPCFAFPFVSPGGLVRWVRLVSHSPSCFWGYLVSGGFAHAGSASKDKGTFVVRIR
jgi:hypothetical protein